MEVKNGNGNGGGGVAAAVADIKAAMGEMSEAALRGRRDDIESPDSDDDRTVLMELLGVLPDKVVKGLRRLLSDYMAGDGFKAGLAMGAAEADNGQGADAVETAPGPPEYGNAGDIKRKVLAAFQGMGDEARQMLCIYMELMSVSGITSCELANEIQDAVYNGNGKDSEAAVDAPGTLWLSGFHDAIDMINATG